MCLYLTKRDGTYYFRRVIPAELRAEIGKREWTFSLRTKDRDDAKRRRDFHALRTSDELDAAMRQAAQRAPVSPSQTGHRLDDVWMGEFAAEEAALAARKASERAVRRLDRQQERERLRDKIHGSTEKMPDRYAAMRDLVREAEERGARSARLEADQSVSRDAQAASQSPQGALSRHAGDIGTPVMLHPDLVDRWAAERRPNAKTIAAHLAVSRWFIERVGEKTVAGVTRKDVLLFKDALFADGQKASNIKVKLSRLRTLTKWAFDNDLAPVNAAAGIDVKIPQGERLKRKPFDAEALRAIFGSPVFTDGARPVGCKGEAAYWIPLLGLFTGARLEELGQLRAGNIREAEYVDGDGNAAKAWVISIEARGEDGHVLKTENSERLVPVHAELIRLGFLDYAAECKGNESARLFPDLKPNIYGSVSSK